MYKGFVLSLSFTVGLCLFAKSYAVSLPIKLPLVQHLDIIYHESGQYNHEVNLVANKAKHWLAEIITRNAKAKHPKQLAVVFDIDETLLSNFTLIKLYLNSAVTEFRVLHSGQNFTIHYKKSMQATAIKPMLRLYNYAKAKHITIFLVTGGLEKNRAYNIKRLHNAGYSGWQKIYFRQGDYKPFKTAAHLKTAARKKIVEQGYDIVFNMGDQYSDLRGGYADRIFKLPNPYYFIP